jgi:hypothetical protein
MPQAEDLIGRIHEEYVAANKMSSEVQTDEINCFVAFARKFLNELPIRGMAADIRGMALQMGDGAILLLNTNHMGHGSPGDHPGYNFIGSTPERRVLGGSSQQGGDVGIFGKH